MNSLKYPKLFDSFLILWWFVCKLWCIPHAYGRRHLCWYFETHILIGRNNIFTNENRSYISHQIHQKFSMTSPAMAKLSPEAKKRLSSVLNVARVTFQYGFIPVILYLGRHHKWHASDGIGTTHPPPTRPPFQLTWKISSSP